MTDTIDRLELLITDSPTEARIRAMNAFASLIKLDKENQVELVQLLLHFHLASSESRAPLLDGVLVQTCALNHGQVGGHGQAALHRFEAGCLSPATGGFDITFVRMSLQQNHYHF